MVLDQLSLFKEIWLYSDILISDCLEWDSDQRGPLIDYIFLRWLLSLLLSSWCRPTTITVNYK